MFLYAKLVTWNLHEQPNRKKFSEEIRPDRLPDGLDQAYVRLCIGPNYTDGWEVTLESLNG